MSEPVALRRQHSSESIGSFVLSPSTTPSSDVGSLSDVGSDFELVSEDELEADDETDDEEGDGHLALSYPDPQYTPSPPLSPGAEEVSGSSIFRSTATMEPSSPTSDMSMPLTVSTLADDNETPTPLAHSLLPDQVDERVEASSEKAPAEEASKEQASTEKSRKPRHPHLGIVRGGSVLACAAVFAVLTLTGTPLYKPSFAVPTSSLASAPVIALSTLPTMAVATTTPFARLSIGSIACTKSLSVTHQCEAKRKCDLAVVAPATQPKVVEAGPSSAKGKTGTEIALTEAWDATVADIRGYLRVQAHILRTARLHQAEAVTRASSYALSLTRKATRKATKQYIRSLPKSLRTAVRQERKRVMKRAKRGARKLIRRDNKALAVREADRVETMGKPAQCKARRKHQHTRRH